MPEKLIGFLSFKESLPQAVIEIVNSRNVDNIRARHCIVGETSLEDICEYSLIVDRVSHLIPAYRPYLKHAVVSGTYVINNPFWVGADDKFYNYSLAKAIGVSVPKTVCLPSTEYPSGILESDLHNLKTELDWEKIFAHIGFPAVLKPYDGYGWRDVVVVNNRSEFFAAYGKSGENVMMLQEFIKYEHYIRCLVVGEENVLPIKYDPTAPFGGKQYIVDHNHLSPELGCRILEDCVKINKALGYDMNSIEFAIRDGIPYAVDFMNPVPDTEPQRISEEYFQWVISKLADVTIEYVRNDSKIIDLKKLEKGEGFNFGGIHL